MSVVLCRPVESAEQEGQRKKDPRTRPRPLYDIPYMFEAREFLRKKLIGKKVTHVTVLSHSSSDNTDSVGLLHLPTLTSFGPPGANTELNRVLSPVCCILYCSATPNVLCSTGCSMLTCSVAVKMFAWHIFKLDSVLFPKPLPIRLSSLSSFKDLAESLVLLFLMLILR